ncbi:MAG TPA: TolC family protein, partial [Nitrospirota bacterium]
TLDDCIKKAVEHSAELKESQYEVEVYRGKKDQADSALYPQVEVIAYGSVSPRAKLVNGRTVESSTNINKGSYDGVFGRATVQLIQPLYTFGKISGYREAAGNGVAAYEAGARLKATGVALQVKEAYYGLLLARETRHLLDGIKEELDKAAAKIEQQIEAEAPNVDQVDLFKMNTYQAELMRYMAQAGEGEEKALYALRVLTGHTEEGMDIADEFLVPADVDMEEFDVYVKRALTDRLEFVQLDHGLKARAALVDVELADYYPQFFLLGFGSIAGATNRDHLNNPYVFDEFNHTAAGAVLGLKWSLDLGMNRGQVYEARAEFMMMRMKEDYAKMGVPFQVKEAYLQVERTRKEMDALNEAYRSAKQWAFTTLSNFDLGVGDARDIAESVSMYARIRADYFRAVYNQRMAVANLEHATGTDASTTPYHELKTGI